LPQSDGGTAGHIVDQEREDIDGSGNGPGRGQVIQRGKLEIKQDPAAGLQTGTSLPYLSILDTKRAVGRIGRPGLPAIYQRSFSSSIPYAGNGSRI